MNRARKTLTKTICTLLFGLTSTSAIAQTCTGDADLAAPAAQLRLAGAFTEGARGITAGLGGGSDAFFSSGAVQFTYIDVADNTQFGLLGVFGSQVTGGSQRNVGVCPIAIVSFGFGPDPEPVTLRTLGFRAGGSAGVIAGGTESFSVVPTFGVAFARDIVLLTLNGVTTSVAANYGIARLGVGFRFNGHRSAVVPAVLMPFALEGANPQFEVSFTTNF